MAGKAELAWGAARSAYTHPQPALGCPGLMQPPALELMVPLLTLYLP